MSVSNQRTIMPFSVDTLQLKSFVAIADTGTYGQAATLVNRTQSALSLQIRKLEEQLGCDLFDRTGRRVVLTHQGEIFLSYSRRIIQLQREAYNRLHGAQVAGEIRFGSPEDFATHYLPGVLSSFHELYPQIRLNVECDMTMHLVDRFNNGEFDAILVKRDPQHVVGGTKVWREPLVWATAEGFEAKDPLSLVLSPHPCIYRGSALAALEKANRPWHISYTSPSLAGTIAAIKAGLGVTVLPARMIPAGIVPIGQQWRLPALTDAELALFKRDGLSKAAQVFVAHIVASLEQKKK